MAQSLPDAGGPEKPLPPPTHQPTPGQPTPGKPGMNEPVHGKPVFDSNPDDPWAKMLKGGTPEQVQKFKDSVINALNQQIGHQRDRMLKALKRLRKGEEDTGD